MNNYPICEHGVVKSAFCEKCFPSIEAGEFGGYVYEKDLFKITPSPLERDWEEEFEEKFGDIPLHVMAGGVEMYSVLKDFIHSEKEKTAIEEWGKGFDKGVKEGHNNALKLAVESLPEEGPHKECYVIDCGACGGSKSFNYALSQAKVNINKLIKE